MPGQNGTHREMSSRELGPSYANAVAQDYDVDL